MQLLQWQEVKVQGLDLKVQKELLNEIFLQRSLFLKLRVII